MHARRRQRGTSQISVAPVFQHTVARRRASALKTSSWADASKRACGFSGLSRSHTSTSGRSVATARSERKGANARLRCGEALLRLGMTDEAVALLDGTLEVAARADLCPFDRFELAEAASEYLPLLSEELRAGLVGRVLRLVGDCPAPYRWKLVRETVDRAVAVSVNAVVGDPPEARRCAAGVVTMRSWAFTGTAMSQPVDRLAPR